MILNKTDASGKHFDHLALQRLVVVVVFTLN